jgi:quercetin dioxygenase-like cupin family protein
VAQEKKDRIFARGVSGEYSLDEERRRRLAAPRVIKAKELPWDGGPGHWNKDVLRPSTEPFRTQTLEVHIESEAPGGVSHTHGHQNEALFYVLEGRGHEIHDGKRYDWEAGDLVVVHNDSVHTHCNDDPDRPSRVLIIKAKPLWMFMGLFQQGYITRASKKETGYRPER